jgi:phosphoglycolate phosphatase
VVEDFDGLLDLVSTSAAGDDSDVATRVSALRPPRRERPAPAPVVEPEWSPARVALVAPQLVLFDWHATLVDTLDAMYRAVDDTLPELESLGLMSRLVAPEQSRSVDDQKLVEYVKAYHQLHPKVKADRKISRTDIFEVLFGADEEAKRIAHATFNKHYRTHYGAVEPFEPHVRDVLVAMRRLGLQIGVITNRDREFFVEELAKVEGTGWAALFDTAVCGDDAPRRKPHPDQLVLAAANVGLAPGRDVWYVGDSTTDTIAAKAAGMTAVFFNGAQWDAQWLATIFPGSERYPYKPDVVVEDFSELFALVLATLQSA